MLIVGAAKKKKRRENVGLGSGIFAFYGGGAEFALSAVGGTYILAFALTSIHYRCRGVLN